MNKSLTAALTCVVLLAVAPPASAGIVPGVAVDGPSNQIDGAAPRVDVAPDGSAALVYLKLVGANLHPFVSTLEDGAWSAPVEVDPALAVTTSGARIAVANGGKVVVTYKKGAAGPLVAQVRPSAGAAFGASQDLAPAGSYAEIDLAGNGNGYAAGSSNNDVFAARLEGTTWTPVAPAVLDKDPLAEAGVGATTRPGSPRRPTAHPALSPGPSSSAGDRRRRCIARRLTGANAGPVGAGAHIVTTLPGADPYGGMLLPSADQPDVDIDASGTAWVAFRQNITYGGGGEAPGLQPPLRGRRLRRRPARGRHARGADGGTRPHAHRRQWRRTGPDHAPRQPDQPVRVREPGRRDLDQGRPRRDRRERRGAAGQPGHRRERLGPHLLQLQGRRGGARHQPRQDHARRAGRRADALQSRLRRRVRVAGRRGRTPVRSRRSPSCRCPELRTARSSPRSSTCRSRLANGPPTPPPPTSPACGSAASASGSARRCRRRPPSARAP